MTLGEAGLVPGRAGVPGDLHSAVLGAGDGPAGPAPGEVRLGGAQPVGASGQHPGAERRVQLVAGEGHPVDVQLGQRDGPVRGELGGVQHDAGAVGVGGGGQFADRPDLPGDVGGAGDADQCRAVRLAGGEGPLQGADGLLVAAGRVEDGEAGGAPGQQRGVVLGLEDEDLAPFGEGAYQQVEGVGGGAGEEELVAGAAAEEGGDGGPALLEEVGGELGEVPGAPVDAAVVGGVGGHVVPDPLEGGGAGGVVEGGVGALPAGGERDGHVGAQNGQRGTNRRFGDGVDGGGGHGYSRSGVRRGVWRRPTARTEKGVRGGGNRGPGPGSYPGGTASLPGRRRPRGGRKRETPCRADRP